MDETLSTITKQRSEEGEGLTLRLGQREFYHYGEDHRWFEQPSGKPVGLELQVLLDELEPLAHELAAEEPKPVDVDELYDELLELFRANDEVYLEETGVPPTPEYRYRISETELALEVLGRDDSVAVAAVREALDRPYLNYGTLRSVYDGPQECC